MEQEQLTRIKKMEVSLNECVDATNSLSDEVERMMRLKTDMTDLFKYYGSEAWYEDRDAELPDGVSAGVLSEDLIYNEITDVRDLAFRMLELATDILKNRI